MTGLKCRINCQHFLEQLSYHTWFALSLKVTLCYNIQDEILNTITVSYRGGGRKGGNPTPSQSFPLQRKLYSKFNIAITSKKKKKKKIKGQFFLLKTAKISSKPF